MNYYDYRKPLQPMLRTPVTTGALSLICIAFQKLPNLFSFKLHPASRHNFSPPSPSPLQKKPNQNPEA